MHPIQFTSPAVHTWSNTALTDNKITTKEAQELIDMLMQDGIFDETELGDCVALINLYNTKENNEDQEMGPALEDLMTWVEDNERTDMRFCKKYPELRPIWGKLPATVANGLERVIFNNHVIKDLLGQYADQIRTGSGPAKGLHDKLQQQLRRTEKDLTRLKDACRNSPYKDILGPAIGEELENYRGNLKKFTALEQQAN